LDWLQHILNYAGQETSLFVSTAMVRLVLAAVLGGIIGLERELKARPAGLRTNMFICFGSALFTILSAQLAAEFNGDRTRIAAQIIPGIGFIGAGSILHSRASVQGLTTAATVFVVASIGMATGGGLYLTAIFATFVIVLGLFFLGRLESVFKLRPLLVTYEVGGDTAEKLLEEVNRILDQEHQAMETVTVKRVDDDHSRVQFSVETSGREQQVLRRRLQESAVLHGVTSLGAAERE